MLVAALLVACTSPWRSPPADPPEDAVQGMTRVLRAAAVERETRFDEALHPGRLAARRRALLARDDMAAYREVGEDLFFLDAPWNAGEPRPITPLHEASGPRTPDATRCAACHHQGGLGGSGSFADRAFFDARGDDAWSARARLPRMLAGAALLELAARDDPSLHPFGYKPGRPRRLTEMVRWSIETHLGETAHADEVDALSVFVALLPPPRRIETGRPSVALRAQRGAEVFASIGCANCHLERLVVASPILELSRGGRRLDLSALMSNTGEPPFAVHAFTDLRVHHLGDELAEGDGADRDAFITAPLWGLGSRGAFLHDGRATTADEAIRAHGGEAAAARSAYLALGERRAELDLFFATLGRTPRMTWLR
jgi:mono/diheme cytochrome c family protein